MPVGMRTSQYTAVGVASAKFTNPMQPGQQYLFSASTNCFVKVTVTGGAASAAADNILYITGGPPLPLCSPDSNGVTDNSYVHVIRDTADGKATLTLVEAD